MNHIHRINNTTIRILYADRFKRTALIHAIMNGHAHIASYLLRLGASPTHADSSGNTCLHYAAAYGWYFCLELLLEAKVPVDVLNDWKVRVYLTTTTE